MVPARIKIAARDGDVSGCYRGWDRRLRTNLRVSAEVVPAVEFCLSDFFERAAARLSRPPIDLAKSREIAGSARSSRAGADDDARPFPAKDLGMSAPLAWLLWSVSMALGLFARFGTIRPRRVVLGLSFMPGALAERSSFGSRLRLRLRSPGRIEDERAPDPGSADSLAHARRVFSVRAAGTAFPARFPRIRGESRRRRRWPGSVRLRSRFAEANETTSARKG